MGRHSYDVRFEVWMQRNDGVIASVVKTRCSGVPEAEVRFMKIEFREAVAADAELLIEIYNSAFYKDFIRYGECPAYGRSLSLSFRSL